MGPKADEPQAKVLKLLHVKAKAQAPPQAEEPRAKTGETEDTKDTAAAAPGPAQAKASATLTPKAEGTPLGQDQRRKAPGTLEALDTAEGQEPG